MLRLVSIAMLVLLAAIVGACGGGSGAADGDPAAGVPRDALFYFEATVRPEGQLRQDALAAAGKVLQTPDPEAKVRELLNTMEDFDYQRDVEPWLGERAAFWISGRSTRDGEPGVAAIVSATDQEAAESAVEKAREREGGKVSTRAHEGVDYEVDEDGLAVAFVDDFVLFGDEPELKRTIDALEGDGLAGDERYRRALDGMADERLAHFYFDSRRLFEYAMKADPEGAEAMAPLKALIPFDRLPPAAGAFMADGSRLALDMGAAIPDDANAVAKRQLDAFVTGGGMPLLEELPADAWAAQGVPQLGETLRVSFGQYAGAFGTAIAKRQLERQFGLDLERDLFSWAGDAAMFVRGDTLDTVGGGAVIQVTDEQAAADAFGRIVGALRSRGQVDAVPSTIRGAEIAFTFKVDAAQPIVLARSRDKVVVAYGTEAAVAALSPNDTLADSDFYRAAGDLLGDGMKPSLLLSLAPVVSLVDSMAGVGRGWQRAKPYVEAFDIVAVGGDVDDDAARVRFAAGLE